MTSRYLPNRETLFAIVLSILLGACSDKPDTMLTSAKNYLAKNDSKAAIIQLKNALQGDSSLPEARFLLGIALLNNGDPVGAELELRKALALGYAQDKVVPPLAQSMLEMGQVKKLTDEFGKIQLSQPSAKAGLQSSLSTAYAVQGMTEASQVALSVALQADPEYAPALVAQARQKAGKRDFDGALAMTENVIGKYPKSYEAWKLKGDILVFAKAQVNDGLAAYRKAVEIKPDFLEANTSVITLLLQQGNLTDAAAQIGQLRKFWANHPQTKYLEAQLAFQKKDFKLARELVQEVLKIVPTNAQGLQLAGAVELQLNSNVQAEGYLSKAVQSAPELMLARRLLIITYLRLGQPGKALTTLLPALNGRNNSVDPQWLAIAGEVYLQNGDVKNAEEYFSRAAKQDPKDPKSRTALALTHLMAGKSESAFSELQDIAASDTGTTADLALISSHLRRQDFDKALKAIDGLEKKQPNKPLASYLKGTIYLAKSDVVRAKQSFEHALTIDPTYFAAVASLSGLDMVEKRPDDAKKRFQAVLAKEPNNGQAMLALADLAAKTGATKEEVAKLIGSAIAANPTEIAPRLLLINFYLKNQDFKAALSEAQNATAALPDSPEMLEALGRSQQASGELNQAITTYRRVVTMQPMSSQSHMHLANLQIATKDNEAASTSLRKAIEIKPDLVEAQRALIVLDVNDKKFQEALAITQTVQKQRPKEAVGYLLEGDVYALQKDWDRAATSYRTGLKQVSSTELALKLHSVLLASGKISEAESFSLNWQKENPKDLTFLASLADTALIRKDYGNAEKIYMALIKVQPDSALAYNNLAWVTGKLNKESAISYAEKANALVPNQPAFMDTLAMLLSAKGNSVKATELEIKALTLQPQNSTFKLNLAKIYLEGGKKDLAKKELEELTKLGDKFAAQAEVTDLLKSL